MITLQCSSCGIQMEDNGSINFCPMCGGKMVSPEAKKTTPPKIEKAPEENDNLPFIPEIERAKMYELASPAVADDINLEHIREPLRKYLEKRTASYSKEIFTVLWEPLNAAIDHAIDLRNYSNQKDAERLINSAQKYLSAGQNVHAGLGFSLLTNSSIDAAAYIGLTALDLKARQGRAELAALSKLNESLQTVKASCGYWTKDVLQAIDKAVADFDVLQIAKENIQKYRHLYDNTTQHDLGVLIEGKNVLNILSAAAHGICGFLGDGNSKILGESKEERKSLLMQLDGAGYITALIYSYTTERAGQRTIYHELPYYITTGKYEDILLSKLSSNSDSKAATIDDPAKVEAYAQAEKALSNRLYYEAATAFARLTGYRDALQRSMRIWQEHLLLNDMDSIEPGRYAICSNGSLIASDSHITSYFAKEAAKWRNTRMWRTVYWKGIDGRLGITFSGRLLCWTKDYKQATDFKEYISRWELKNVPLATLSNTYPGSDIIAAVYQNGAARVFGPKAAKYNNTVSQWTDIKEVVCGNESVVGIKHDGTVCAVGDIAKYSYELSTWQNIRKICFSDWDEIILGMTFDGKVYAAGKSATTYQNKLNRDDIVDINSYMMGLTSSGQMIVCKSPKSSFESWCSALHGVIAVEQNSLNKKFMALKLDGTVVTYGFKENLSHWNNIVAVFESLGWYGLRSDGTFFVAECRSLEKTREEQELMSQWKLFNHIDTYQDERQVALTEFAAKPTAPQKGGCYVATAVYGSYDCPQVWTLRRFRDYTLAETWYGRAFIRTYYAISPTLVKWFRNTDWFKKMWKGKLDRMVANLNAEGVEDTPYEDRNW